MDSQQISAMTEQRFDRVRDHTAPEVNRRIDEQTSHSLRLYAYADKELVAHRLEELDREWDMERTLEANAAGISLAGLVLGTVASRKWFLLPAVVASFLMLHAVQGWCPPVPIFRRRGVRTRKEIERERTALKLLRGDFDSFHSGEEADVNKVLDMLGR
jgi:hypothetical protein